MKEKPYIEQTKITTKLKYNPNYGDNRICKCGHPYYRHFDSYDDMRNVGCKYCSCAEFVEEEKIKQKKVSHTIYINRETEDALYDGEKIGLTGKALDNYSGCGYEVTFSGYVDMEKGDFYATEVNGVKLEKPVNI